MSLFTITFDSSDDNNESHQFHPDNSVIPLDFSSEETSSQFSRSHSQHTIVRINASLKTRKRVRQKKHQISTRNQNRPDARRPVRPKNTLKKRVTVPLPQKKEKLSDHGSDIEADESPSVHSADSQPSPRSEPIQKLLPLPTQSKQMIASDPLESFLTYRILKEKNFSITRNHVNFHFSLQNAPLFDTNFHFSKHGLIQIFPHLLILSQTQKDYTNFPSISSNHSKQLFTLYKNANTCINDKLMEVEFQSHSPDKPQVASIRIYKDKSIICYKTLEPKLHRTGAFMLDFHHRKAVRSVKNCIFIDSNKEESIFVRKVAPGTLFIDAKPNIDPIHLFTIGIASMMKKK